MNEAVLIDRDGRPTLRFERRLQASPERVWRAVTDEHEMRSWFPSAVQGERKVGAPLAFPFDTNVADTFEGEVTEWEPMRVFAFTWNGDDLRIELEADGDGTTLVFIQSMNDLSGAARTASGWDACLASLDDHLGGPAIDAPDLWKQTYATYLDRMGPPPAAPTRQWSFTWERTHHVSPERMWECLTDPKELESWMGNPVTLDLHVGGSIRFDFEPDGNAVEGVIVACEVGRRIAYTFGSLSVVEWQVAPTEHGSRYVLSQHGMPKDRAAAWGAGWHSFLLQLDMYAAAGQLVVDADHERRIPTYEALLAG